jgi:hypothetical protein
MLASLRLVADVSDQRGEAGNEIVHPGILTPRLSSCARAFKRSPSNRFIIQDLKSALLQSVLWQRH